MRPGLDHTATLEPRDPVEAAAPARLADEGRYELVCEHARGGLGRIVRAVDRWLGREVAVKELLSHDARHQARLLREAFITARLQHPGIVPVHEAGRWPTGEPYYVMKLVEGRTLKELLVERTTLRERLALLPHVIAIADAIGYAHGEGVIHRDVKPSNVIVGNFGETVVVDWGLALESGDDHAAAEVVGTPAYMAPEQARGERVDERVDVYAIGVILYELVAGAAPYGTTSDGVLARVVNGPPPALAVRNAPRELVAIVDKAMARDPEHRYRDARELAAALRGLDARTHAPRAPRWPAAVRRIALAAAVLAGGLGMRSLRAPHDTCPPAKPRATHVVHLHASAAPSGRGVAVAEEPPRLCHGT